MKRNSTLVCKVLLTTFTIFSLNFTTVNAQVIAASMPAKNTSFVASNTLSETQYSFPAIAPGIDAFITVLNKPTSNTDKSVNIKWITELEQGIDHFEIERSFDNVNFKTIAIVLDGFSTGVIQKTYMFKDNSTALKGKTTVYYRLKQLSPMGNGTSSKLLTVNLIIETPALLELAPVRFLENLYVDFTAPAANQTILSTQSVSKGV